MIDAGVGIRTLKKYFKEYGVNQSLIRHILVTHDHADHIKSVGILSHDWQVPVYASREVHVGIERNYSVHRKVNKEWTCMIEKGKEFMLGEFRVVSFEVPHDSTDNVGFFIEHRDTSFCIITDAGHVTSEMAEYIGKANYLVIEANHDEEMVVGGSYPRHLQERILSERGHLSNKMCGVALAENMTERLRKVWLCHLSEENNHPELARKTVVNVLGSYGILIDKDIDVEVLKRKNPTGFYELT